MPPHIIIIGMPVFIRVIIRSQHSVNMSFMDSSIDATSHFMPVGVMEQVILHIIIAIGIMPPVMCIGIMLVMGIMEPIIGIGIAAVSAGLHCMVTACFRRSLHTCEREPPAINANSWASYVFV